MEAWKGLFKKEWVIMKWKVIALILVNVAIAIISVSPVYSKVPKDFILESQFFRDVWILIHLIIGLLLLYQSLGREMNRADIWLHSPVSIGKLVGAKGLFSAFIVTCSLLVCGTIVGVFYYVGGGTVPISAGVVLLFSAIAAIFLSSIYVMGVGFFFWSIDQVGNSRIGWFSILITLGLFRVWAYFGKYLYSSKVIGMIKDVGTIQITGSISFFEENYIFENNYFFWGFFPEGALLSIGSFVLFALFTVIYFAFGSILFEKKVRL